MKQCVLVSAIVAICICSACADVFLDCSFGKDDLPEVDILYANTEHGVFAYKLDSKKQPTEQDACAHGVKVVGGGTRHLIKGLNPPMSYNRDLPLAILGDDSFIFHTDEWTRFSDGRWREYRLFTWAVRFHGNRWDKVDVYLYRRIQRTESGSEAVGTEQRFTPDGKLASNKAITFPKRGKGRLVVPLSGQLPMRVSIDDGDLCLDGKVVLSGEPNRLKPFSGYSQPDMGSQTNYMVFLDYPKKTSLLRSSRVAIKLLDLQTGKVRTLRQSRNVPRSPQISPDGTWVLFLEKEFLYILGVTSGELRKIDKASVANWAYRL